MTSERIGDWIQTYTGRQFWPLDPRVDEIHIEDIAHSLSMRCCYGGHLTDFYSVAEHSVLVSLHVPQEFALWGLLHDAAEAPHRHLPPVLLRRREELPVAHRVAEGGIGDVVGREGEGVDADPHLAGREGRVLADVQAGLGQRGLADDEFGGGHGRVPWWLQGLAP